MHLIQNATNSRKLANIDCNFNRNNLVPPPFISLINIVLNNMWAFPVFFSYILLLSACVCFLSCTKYIFFPFFIHRQIFKTPTKNSTFIKLLGSFLQLLINKYKNPQRYPKCSRVVVFFLRTCALTISQLTLYFINDEEDLPKGQ